MIAAALIGAAGSILGNVLQRQAQKRAYARQQEQLDAERADNAAWYNRRYYEDATQRADTQRALTRAREALLASSRAASGHAVMSGSTNAAAAAAKEANNKAYADIVSQAAAAAETRKDKVEDAYLAQQRKLDESQRTLDNTNDQANANAIGQMASQVGKLAASAVAAEMNKPNTLETTPTATVPVQTTPQQQQLNLSTPVVAGQAALGTQMAAGRWDLMNGMDSSTAALGQRVREMELNKWGKLFE